MADSTSSVTSALTNPYQTQIDSLVNTYKATLTKPIDTLNAQKTSLNNLQKIYNSLKTQLSSLRQSAIDFSATDSSSILNLTSVVSSNTNLLNVTSSGTPVSGDHSIFISQLAKTDKVISSRLKKTDTNVIEQGVYKFEITIGGNSYDISTDISSSDTAQNIIQKVADAINSSDAKNKVSASLISDTKNSSRLVIAGKDTGSSNAITISDISGNLLNKLGFFGNGNGKTNNSGSEDKTASGNTRVASKGQNGGYFYSDVNALDANLTVDGVDIVNESNKITDVISGITLELKGTQNTGDADITVSSSTDKTNIVSNINTFIKNYNSVVQYLNTNMANNDGQRAALTGDSILRGLRDNLRALMTSKVSSVQSGNPNFLSQIGITLNSDGTLTLSDSTKLNTVLDDDPSKVSDLFNSSKGIAVQMKAILDPFAKTGGILDKRTDNTAAQIKSIATRIVDTQAEINTKADAYRAKYTQLIQVIQNLNSQQAMLTAITNASSSSSSTSSSSIYG